MRRLHAMLVLSGLLLPQAAAAQVRVVPAPLLGLPAPAQHQNGAAFTFGGWSADDRQTRVNLGVEAVADWFLFSAALGLSVLRDAGGASVDGLEPVEHLWPQASFALGAAPPLRVLGDADGDGVAVVLYPVLRGAADLALIFEDDVVPYRLRAETGLIVAVELPVGLRLSFGGTWDFDLTHLAEEAASRGSTLRLGGAIGYAVPEGSAFAKTDTPTLLSLGITGELALEEVQHRAPGIFATVGVSY